MFRITSVASPVLADGSKDAGTWALNTAQCGQHTRCPNRMLLAQVHQDRKVVDAFVRGLEGVVYVAHHWPASRPVCTYL